MAKNTNPTPATKLTNVELKAEYALKKDAAKEHHDPSDGKFDFPTFSSYKSQYYINWDLTHPLDEDALVPSTTTVLKVVESAIDTLDDTEEQLTKEVKVSKLSLARTIFAQEFQAKGESGLVRKDILSRFISEAGCTIAGANTYYNTLRSEYNLVRHTAPVVRQTTPTTLEIVQVDQEYQHIEMDNSI